MKIAFRNVTGRFNYLNSTIWYLTGNRLDGYIANYIKYRYLKLNTVQKGLQFYLHHTDSLYNAYRGLSKNVLQTEAQNHVNFGGPQRAKRLNAEAKDLEKAVRKTNL